MLITKPHTDFQPVHTMLMKSLSAKVLMSAMNLKLFDYIEGREVDGTVLAHEMGLVPERLEPVLDIFVAVDLLFKNQNRYSNSPTASEFLVSTAPHYQGDSMALTMGFADAVENSITELLSGAEIDRKKTDKNWAVERTMEGAAQEAIGGGLADTIEFTASLPNFDNFRTMCDIGGNHGMYTMGVLDRNENMQGTIFDLPHVAEQAQIRCDKAGFGARVTTTGLDFLKEHIPAEQFDLILTSHVLYAFQHDLDTTLTKIAEGLKPGGWFVSHHYSGYGQKGNELTKATLELLTRLSGYSSHFIEQGTLVKILKTLKFEDIRCQPISETGLGLMVAARKAY